MTTDQVKPPEGISAIARAEWFYIYSERLGLSCADGIPSVEEVKAAKLEADKAIQDL